MDLLTASSLSTMRSCPRQHWFKYELMLSKDREAAPLRMGSAFHEAMHLKAIGSPDGLCLHGALKGYEHTPEWADPVDWATERETVKAMVKGHFRHWREQDITFICAEQEFKIPLVNPETDRASRTFCMAGKIDGIVRLHDGRLGVMEYKTSGDQIHAGSDYWMRMQCDPQIGIYIIAARALGHDVVTVAYDVTRKPSIKRRKASNETPEEFGQRYFDDMLERPEFYFRRAEIPALHDDIEELRYELWQQAKNMIDARKAGRWFRNVSRFTCQWCDFAPVCLGGGGVTPGTAPRGYVIREVKHPELERIEQ